MDHVREIIGEHPQRGSYYGYRRILPELEERTGRRVNHKRLRRLLSEHELGLSRHAAKGKNISEGWTSGNLLHTDWALL